VLTATGFVNERGQHLTTPQNPQFHTPTRQKTVTHRGTNRARRGLTSLVRRTPLTTTPRRQRHDVVLSALANNVEHAEYIERLECPRVSPGKVPPARWLIRHPSNTMVPWVIRAHIQTTLQSVRPFLYT